jgi:hypothetical protein
MQLVSQCLLMALTVNCDANSTFDKSAVGDKRGLAFGGLSLQRIL